ncbi:NAD(+) diphosphatase [Shumkonia mesophila]|uniref:NAD(+) diphosphatase n=1 Tax=Shumkonia mesophila TaxID=2838854 RepID=UPI002934A5D6|nr:NAD(+) diphosphatase [Shumkonia mesophila]
MTSTIFYTGSRLDRVDALRDDAEWVAARLADPKCRVLPVWRDRNLVGVDTEPCLRWRDGAAAQAVLERATEVVLLGLDGETAYFAADLSALEEQDAIALCGEAQFADLRQVAAAIDPHDASLLAHARGMAHWHRRHRFCGICGSPTRASDAGHMRKCTNPACAQPHFPRTDPAVIMLVTRPGPGGGSCLLAHKAGFLPGMYSTLAGFVEPGESLEEAVAREVMEEAGVAVADVTYRASQPWPFPASLMLGYRAVAVTDVITVNPRELVDAFWFTKDDIARLGETGRRLPRPDSIALWLIREWLEEGGA